MLDSLIWVFSLLWSESGQIRAALSDIDLALERESCRRDAHYFIFDSGHLKTKDEHDTDHPSKTMYDSPYLRVLLDTMLVSGHIIKPEEAKWALKYDYDMDWLTELGISGILFVEKSRQMLVSWMVCAYLLWRARALSHQLILVQSKREEDAANLVFTQEAPLGRMSFMEWSLPSWLKMIDFPHGCKYCHMVYPNGSHLWAIPEGSDIIRSNTVSVLFGDEAAFQPEFGNAYTAALPSIKGGGSAVFVSSAEPGEFAELVEAEV